MTPLDGAQDGSVIAEKGLSTRLTGRFRTGAEEKRKTINGDDLIFALQNLGFEEYVPPLQSYLAQYRRVSKQKEKE